ncbi:unnamed protein product [Heligmosomoides polygyrus]|uniref:HTH_48 domain-containing protein n=1 Tax=Heligmosomoides polygyrus TaxID=6339 RepID=A0A183GQY6_HELPZ|nr:unnamed protein product [Heligmosomoides polygyrus]
MAEKIVLDCKQVRLLLLYEFKKQSSARAAVNRNVGSYYGLLPQVWFRKFKNGSFCLEDPPRFGRPVAANEDRLLELVPIGSQTLYP